jgi:outer membrane protein OmpA-like peptidoglycan-associated protein
MEGMVRARRMLKRAIAGALMIAGCGMASAQQAADAPPGQFLVFFDWGKPDLRGDDAATLDQITAAYRAHPGARLQLSGHTDRSGSAATNRLAGLRRADAVRAELEKRGVPRNAMTVASFGEERPLVPTEDGVREVQNRRVEIVFEE